MTTRGTHQIQGNDIQVQGYKPDDSLGEIKQSSLISPLIIKDNQLNFEPLKALTLRTMTVPTFDQFGFEFLCLQARLYWYYCS